MMNSIDNLNAVSSNALTFDALVSIEKKKYSPPVLVFGLVEETKFGALSGADASDAS